MDLVSSISPSFASTSFPCSPGLLILSSTAFCELKNSDRSLGNNSGEEGTTGEEVQNVPHRNWGH